MVRRNGFLCLLGLILTLLAGGGGAQSNGAENGAEAHVALLTVDGAIGPATTTYLMNNMDAARQAGARAIVIQIDTPGGLDAATREIVQAILASPIPVITYVHPSGARAASAGTYILYASHLAAMTPATTLGAATPVKMGGGGREQKQPKGQGETEGGDAGSSKSAMERKVVNDSVAFIRGLANRHHRNAEWAEKAVREAATLTAGEAKAANVIEIVAGDVEALLAQADGATVQMESGARELAVAELPVRRYDPGWRDELLALITNPQVAYILLLIGIYGLIFEGYSPGAMVPGVVGIICLLTAFYALQLLPVNYAGLALIIVGALLMVAEAFVASFGVLGIGGVVALVIGSVMLIDTDVPEMMVSRELIGAIGGVSALAMLGVIYMIGRSLKIPRPTASKEMVGRSTHIVHSDPPYYQVRLQGELWQARSEQPLQVGQRVRVTAQHGLTLTVEPVTVEQEENNHV